MLGASPQHFRNRQRSLQSRLFCAHFFIGRQAWKGHPLLQQTQDTGDCTISFCSSPEHTALVPSIQALPRPHTWQSRAEPLALKRVHKAGQAGAVSFSVGMLNPCPPWGSLSLAGAGEGESSMTAACSQEQTPKGGRWG